MSIEYKEIHEFEAEQLKDLFLSVEWSSGHYPDKLVVAMKNFQTVYSAWEGEKLVGMICAMDDGKWIRIEATAYLHNNIDAQKHMLAAYPSLQKMYQPGDGNTEVFYLRNVTAKICSFTEEPKIFKF